MPLDLCPDCGGEVSNGPCPRCLVKLGIDEAGPAQDRVGETLDLPARPGSVLETIAATIGAVPHVLLRDTAFGEEPSPIIRPSNGQDSSTRYRIDGEIARGGMGAILKGRDPDLGRDVAIKVLREDLRGNDDLVRRFVEEAQIGGQLQHPGIVPIYELGTFADRRPFFCMKLVKGQTLAELLAGRPTSATDLPRFLAIFAAMAQTMAYAHTRGVIHRDLKPSNVMVGSFGEVQVMDWGLAKVPARGGIVDDAKAGKEPAETMIATARSGSDLDLSHAGSVLGTPSYMPPEQARGETDHIDERADVFALGSILAEILTGQPAFTGRTSGEILRKAAKGDTTDILAKLAACGAETDLIVLAKDCLAAEAEDRPRDATAVADRITGYLASVQERVQTAERDRAVAVARAFEERKRRKVQLALAASVLAITTMGGLGALYEQRQRAARAATVAKVVGEASAFRDLARAVPEDIARWQTALAALKQAEGVAGDDPEALGQLAALKVEVQAGAEAADRDRTLLDKLVQIRLDKTSKGRKAEALYAAAFREAGLDLGASPSAEAGVKIKARPPGVAVTLAAALDDWAELRRGLRDDPAGAERLVEVAGVADPDPWRNGLRAALARSAKGGRIEALKDLAGSARFDELGPISLDLLGNALAGAGDLATAERVLRRAQVLHPGDFWVNYHLAECLVRLDRRDDAIRFYTAARVLRPQSAQNLAIMLGHKGESDEAIGILQGLARLLPGDGGTHDTLGSVLGGAGRLRESAQAYERAAAISREQIKLDPDPERAHAALAFALSEQGKLDEAVAEYREAIRLKPAVADYHLNLGFAFSRQGKPDEAIAEYREAIRLQPKNSTAHLNLAFELAKQEKPDEAIAEYREAIRLQPSFTIAHSDLADFFASQGKWDDAVAEYREAIRLNPNFFSCYSRLGRVLQCQGDYAGSLAMIRRAHELGSKLEAWDDPKARRVAEAEFLAGMAGRLPALLTGEERPKDVRERLALANLCYNTNRHATAAQFWAEALEADPKLADDRLALHRYNAACSAALAGTGSGKEELPPDDTLKAKLRGQAFGWLKADLVAWAKVLESGPSAEKGRVARVLKHWKVDADLAAIRNAKALGKLPEAEREDWRALWAEVDATLAKAGKP